MAQTLERRVRIIPATQNPTTVRGPRRGRQRVAAYCRVSTDSKEQLNSYQAQKAYFTQKIQENPDWEMAGVFADEGLSGTSLKKRKEFNKMIAACKRGRIDMILTKSLSRFARNTVDCLETVRMLKANGIGVIFEKENINTLTESSEFLITLFSGFSQAEIESLSQNVTWGKQKSMEDGNVSFQYEKMLGYRKGADGAPEIVPAEADTVYRIYRRYLDGCSLGQIKEELEADHIPTARGIRGWSYQVIRNILTNEKYMGDALLGKTYITDCISKKVKKNNGERPMYYVENSHQAIIPKDMYQRVQEEMTRRSSKRKVMQKTGRTEQGKYSGKYALSELLVCGECGTPYKRVTWARNGRKRIVWRCISRLEYGTQYCHKSPTLDEEKLHRAIQEAINEFAQAAREVKTDLLEFTALAWRGQEGDGAALLSLRQKLADITAQQTLLLDQALENMEDASLNAQLKALMDEKQVVQEQIQALEQHEIHSANQAARLEELREWMAQLEINTEYDDFQTRMAVEKITVVDAETIRIRFKYPGLELEKKLT
ncbi:recombinase family protein [Flavonifractor plautii]|uniref:recombinase family protein n=1 Tax=Flavonifractor plautii TaxID=292800 RepID=UPI0012AC47C8|nr:recombinase family protein [Flavonifractor plautii]